MANLENRHEDERKASDRGFGVGAPALRFPKGAGAVRSIAETVTTNAVARTGSTSVPIASSPGRSGSGRNSRPHTTRAPAMALSGSVGVCRFRQANARPTRHPLSTQMRRIPTPSSSRAPKTWCSWIDRPLTVRESMVIRATSKTPTGFWVRDPAGGSVVHEDELDGHCVRRFYRPRIERWTRVDEPSDVRWRSISKGNIHSLRPRCELAHPDPLGVRRLFKWLICQTRGGKGYTIIYRYRADRGLGVELGKAQSPTADQRTTRAGPPIATSSASTTATARQSRTARAFWTIRRSTAPTGCSK